jgi:predicted GTPase
MADVAVINKMDSASPEGIQTVRENIEKVAPNAIVVDGASPIVLMILQLLKERKYWLLKTDQHLTHGKMKLVPVQLLPKNLVLPNSLILVCSW